MKEMKTLKFPNQDEAYEIVDAYAREQVEALDAKVGDTSVAEQINEALSNIQNALIGTTDNITPSQVYQALTEGRQIVLTHGETVFSNFTYDKDEVKSITIKGGEAVFDVMLPYVYLHGDIIDDYSSWYAEEINLPFAEEVDTLGAADTAVTAHNSDASAHSDIRNAIPTKTSQLTNDSGFVTSVPTALKNPYSLNINGTVYDGSKEESITTNPLYVTVTKTGSTWTLGNTLDEIETAYQNGRAIFLKYSSASLVGYEVILGLKIRFSATHWLFSNIIADSVYVNVTLTDLNNTEYTTTFAKDNEVPTDSHINSLIDAKLAAITNAEEVAF